MILKVIEIFINEYLHLDLTQNIYMKTNNNIDDMTKDYFIDFVISNTNILRQLIFCNKVIYNTVINFIKIYFNKNRLLFYRNSLYTIITYKLQHKCNNENIYTRKIYHKYECVCDRCKHISVNCYFLSYNWTYIKNPYCLYNYDKYNLINRTKLLGITKNKIFKLKPPIFVY